MNIRTSLFILCLLMSSYSYSDSRWVDFDFDDFGIRNRVYIEPSHLHILPEGIFYEDKDGELTRTNHVFCDQWGIFLMPEDNFPRLECATTDINKMKFPPYY